MKKKRFRLRLVLAAAWIVVLSVAVTGYTYAWFSVANLTAVKITPISGTTATQDVRLEISLTEDGFTDIDADTEWALAQLQLYPVSTANLVDFVADAGEAEQEGNTTVFRTFQILRDESRYFHAVLYLRAAGSNLPSDSVLDLYLGKDTDVTAEDTALRAARLGLRFSDDTEDNVHIFFLTERRESELNDENITELGGTVLSDAVLTVQNGAITAVADPSVSLGTFTAGADSLPETPLMKMTVGTVYRLDVYFYLEGCDPACTVEKARVDTNLKLSFYGVLE